MISAVLIDAEIAHSEKREGENLLRESEFLPLGLARRLDSCPILVAILSVAAVAADLRIS